MTGGPGPRRAGAEAQVPLRPGAGPWLALWSRRPGELRGPPGGPRGVGSHPPPIRARVGSGQRREGPSPVPAAARGPLSPPQSLPRRLRGFECVGARRGPQRRTSLLAGHTRTLAVNGGCCGRTGRGVDQGPLFTAGPAIRSRHIRPLGHHLAWAPQPRQHHPAKARIARSDTAKSFQVDRLLYFTLYTPANLTCDRRELDLDQRRASSRKGARTGTQAAAKTACKPAAGAAGRRAARRAGCASRRPCRCAPRRRRSATLPTPRLSVHAGRSQGSGHPSGAHNAARRGRRSDFPAAAASERAAPPRRRGLPRSRGGPPAILAAPAPSSRGNPSPP
jgi:hypothetical protein